MYLIDLRQDVSKYEVEELIKLFIPSSDYIITSEKALDQNQSFSVIFEGTPAKIDDKDYYFKGQIPFGKKEVKNFVKRGLYDVLSKQTDYYPPWGILTGVKPSKIVRELEDEGISEDEIRIILSDYYFLNDEKAELLLKVAHNQRNMMLPSYNKKAVGLYIGIPFCPTRCIYCSFTSNVGRKEQIDEYMKALCEEIKYVSEKMKKEGMYPESIYIGGGTPTVLDAKTLDMLISLIKASFEMSKCLEFTVEAGRPDTITKEKLEVIKKHNIERISINPQSMNQKTLDAIGRSHTPEEIEDAFRVAKESGIQIINTDVIAGLPGEDLKDFENTINKIIELEPENITVHTLALKRASRLKEEDSQYTYRERDKLADMVELSANKMKAAGYEPYYLYRQKYMAGNFENVGYAKKGTECIYNVKIMDERQTIIALGAGGISKVYYPENNRLERVANVSNYELYIERIEEMLDRKDKLLFANEQ